LESCWAPIYINMSLGHKQLSKIDYLTNHPEATTSPVIVTSKNVKKSEKFFRKFQNEIDKAHRQAGHTYETTSLISNPFELIRRQRKLLTTPAGTQIQEFDMCEQSLPVISKSDNGSSGRSYPIKLSKTSLNAHNLMLNQERVSGIPVVINSDKYKKKKLNERQLETMSQFDR